MENKELIIFRRINEAISLAPDVEAVARSILDIVIDETPAENASIMMPTSGQKQARDQGRQGKERQEKPLFGRSRSGQIFSIGEGIAGVAALERKAHHHP
ncbi:MAG: hypothetical protein MZU79_00095 [Anaerotruncus sp.]|nr:hypothetical protein [Anaerotruncus sp.]